MLAENIDQWKDQYREEGIEKGIDLGRCQALRELLEDRFGSLPDSVTSYIENSSDSGALRKLLLFASQAQSLQAVIDQIKSMTGPNSSSHTYQPA